MTTKTKQVRAFFLDVLTRDSASVLRTLRRYTSTHLVYHDGHYLFDRGYSRIYLETTLTESSLEAYLYKNKTTPIVGIVEATRR